MKYTLVIIALVLALLAASDVRVQHFEDGSGRITYCLPLAWCADSFMPSWLPAICPPPQIAGNQEGISQPPAP